MYFFRDSHGNEVDLLIREQGVLTPVEIKSASTFATDFLREWSAFKPWGSNAWPRAWSSTMAEQRLSVRGLRIQSARRRRPLDHLDCPWREGIGIVIE